MLLCIVRMSWSYLDSSLSFRPGVVELVAFVSAKVGEVTVSVFRIRLHHWGGKRSARSHLKLSSTEATDDNNDVCPGLPSYNEV